MITLAKKSKSRLIDDARFLGLTVDESWTMVELRDAIARAQDDAYVAARTDPDPDRAVTLPDPGRVISVVVDNGWDRPRQRRTPGVLRLPHRGHVRVR